MQLRSGLTRAHVLAGAGAALLVQARPAGAQTLEKIRMGGVPTDDLTPVFFAIRNGLYAKAGLDVEYVPTSSGTAATQAAVSGAYDMGKGSLIASLVAHLRGLPLTVVANGALWDPKVPFSLMLVAADSPIRKASDLNGKTAATAALNDLNQLAFSAWIDKNGGDSKTLKWVEVPNSAAAAALEEHRIDTCGLNEPQLTAALETKKVRVLAPAYSAIAPRFVFTLYFANADWAAKHGDAIKKWVKVTYEAAAYTNAHKTLTEPMIAEITKIPMETIKKIGRVNGATSSDPSLIQPVIDAAAKYKNISQSFPAKDAYFRG